MLRKPKPFNLTKIKRFGFALTIVLLGHGFLLWGIMSYHSDSLSIENTPIALPQNTVELWPNWRQLRKISVPSLSKRKTKPDENKLEIQPTPKPSLPEPIVLPKFIENTSTNTAQIQLSEGLKSWRVCLKARKDGRDVPAQCQSGQTGPQAALGAQKPIAPRAKDQVYWDKVVKKHEDDLEFQRQSGNADFWKRVTSPKNYRDDSPRPGAYRNAKEQSMYGSDIKPDSAYQRARDGG